MKQFKAKFFNKKRGGVKKSPGSRVYFICKPGNTVFYIELIPKPPVKITLKKEQVRFKIIL